MTNPPTPAQPLRLIRQIAGFSVAEAVVAMAIGSMALAGAMSINTQQLRTVKSTRESSAASHSMQERVEQLRIATWRQITDPEYVAGTLLATLPKSIAPLSGYTERLTLVAWPDPEAAPKLIVEKTPKSGATIISRGAGLADLRLAKVDVQIRWTVKGRTRTRELTTIISNGGISRMNLPAMGPAGGGDWPTSATTTSEPAPSSSSTSGTTTTTTSPTTTSPTSTTTTSSTTTASSTSPGNGRGSVGGKPGKQ